MLFQLSCLRSKMSGAWDCFGSDESDEESSHVEPATAFTGIGTHSARESSRADLESSWWILVPKDSASQVPGAPSSVMPTADVVQVAAQFSAPPLFQDSRLQFVRMNHRGGGRGVICTADIAAGTMLMAELPLLFMPTKAQCEEQAGLADEICVAALLDLPSDLCSDILKDLEVLHPQSLSEIGEERVQVLKARYKKALVKGIETRTAQELKLTDDQILRVFCALRSNAFETGVYCVISMINHSCRPNCIKWSGGQDGRSELQAVRDIRAGEEITISYLEPWEQSRRSRRVRIPDQFEFTCTCELCDIEAGSTFEELEKLYGSDQPTSTNPQDIERTFSEELDALELSIAVALSAERTVAWGRVLRNVLENAVTARKFLGPLHWTALRAHRLICSACSELLAYTTVSLEGTEVWAHSVCNLANTLIYGGEDHVSEQHDAWCASVYTSDTRMDEGGSTHAKVLPPEGVTFSLKIQLLVVFFNSLVRLRAAQILYLGTGMHPKAFETLRDLGQVIVLLLAQGRVGEVALEAVGSSIMPLGNPNSTAWARFAAACEKSSRGIQSIFGLSTDTPDT